MFPSIQNNINEIIPIITQHLELLEEKITKYFPAFNIEKYDWIRNSFFTTNTLFYEFTLQEEEELITLSTDRTLKIKFSEITIEEFWISIQTDFKNISEKAIKILLKFSTPYLCKYGFSTLTNIKTKKRERLTNIAEEMRVALSHRRLYIENVCNSYQTQLLH
ncbi:zinc finger BED domain-containing protein 5-like isoform X2 [Aphis craccivora]|uniref:Zinc finger BED domain-containing protein 5-like isoform X2 n=1 Tax=Aphis craccivora TaxID=307492 RepID=A0A6G0VKF7_APHCR|nr:zinc finger BED domain-containing protein 5-like isoform X2 [Aphis craccivora]